MSVTIFFRTNDGAQWGMGLGANLTPSQIDQNFWNLKEAVEQLQEDLPEAANSIVSFTVSGNQFYVNMSDNTTLGPYDFPIVKWNYRGKWGASIAYIENDVVTYGYSTYLVLVSHTSGGSFDPDDNDGEGNSYYQLILQMTATPKHAVITGGPPGNLTVPGLAVGDTLTEVLAYYDAPFSIVDLTEEFTISASEQINNTTGTDTTSAASIVVRWSTTS